MHGRSAPRRNARRTRRGPRSRLPARTRGLSPRRRQGHGDRRCSRRPQHQRGCRLAASRGDGQGGRQRWRCTGLRFRWRRRPLHRREPTGRAILDGDFALYYAGSAWARESRLPSRTVVATVMSNLGLEKALAAHGVAMLRAAVGDRYVLQAMREGGYALGGEQSGHVIFMDFAPTGDGILTALTIARLAQAGAGDPDEALSHIPHYPQVLRNVRVRSKPRIEEHPVLADAVRRAELAMGADGRVVVRYSGTEPKARVMIEGADEVLVHRLADEVLAVFQREIGE
ncbi:MAG: hypothetical protein HC882_08680 [Acidobacteria bacterium]|nr:hypothetical protein [Acidobacteriota bacterium]